MTASDYRGTVKRIVIAGGIGAGKSAVAQRLRDLGFSVVDADDVAHEVTAPGSRTLATLVDAFGSAVLDGDGALDRAFVADVDRAVRAATWPAHLRQTVRRLGEF